MPTHAKESSARIPASRLWMGEGLCRRGQGRNGWILGWEVPLCRSSQGHVDPPGQLLLEALTPPMSNVPFL